MSYESFFAGVGATLLGTLIGAWLGPRLMYPFQKKLLEQQLEFQKQQGAEDARQRKEIAEAQTKVMETARHVLRDLSNHVGSLNYNLSQDMVKRAQQEKEK